MAFVEKKLPADAPIAQKALGWVDSRFPLSKLWNDQWGKYHAPKNFNFFYLFGSLAALVLGIDPSGFNSTPASARFLRRLLT